MGYNKNLIEKFQNLNNVGIIKNADGVGVAKNNVCGDTIKVYLQIKDDVIIDAKFKTFGGVAAIALSDITMDIIKNKTIDEALVITGKDVCERLGCEIPTKNTYCSILAQEAVSKAVQDYRKKQLKKVLNV